MKALVSSGGGGHGNLSSVGGAWLGVLICLVGLTITLAGSSKGAGLFVLTWGLLIAPRASACMPLAFRSPLLWLVPGFALISVFWSEAPLATLRAAIELLLTVGAASLTAVLLRPKEFVSAMLVSLLFGAIWSLQSGQYGVDGMTGEIVFLGVFASKNTMAFFMSFLAILAIAIIIDRDQSPIFRLLAVLSIIVSIPLLMKAHSAGALLTTAASFVALFLIHWLVRLQSPERVILISSGIAMILPVIIVMAILALNGTLTDAATDFITGVLGKDTTLTGRTVLWHIALDQIAQRPFLGVGYSAFWQQGNLLAESIWRYFSIDSRMGFEFHDTYLEVAVELGWLGTATLVITMMVTVLQSARLAFADKRMATSALFAAAFCLLVRTIAEVDVPYPFSIGTYLLFVIAAYGNDFARFEKSAKRRAGLPQRLRPMRAAESAGAS